MSKRKSSYKVKANDFEFSFTSEEIADADMIEIAPGVFNIIKNGRSINVHLLANESDSKKITVEVEGQNFDIEIKEALDQLLQEMGFGLASHIHIKKVNAPMPGLVLDILVTAGQEVNAGDPILILQAMKMENSIAVHASATIKKILVVKGEAVEKGQLLIELE